MTQPVPTALEQFFELQLVDQAGVIYTKRPILKMLAGTVADDAANNQTLYTPGGASAFATLVDDFTQPAVSANVTAHVTSDAWTGPGAYVFVVVGGVYQVASITDSTHAVLTNTGATGNASPGATVTAGSLVTPSGPPGPSTTTDFPAPGSALSANTTLATTDTWKEFAAGAYTISLPASPVTGRTIELTHVSGVLESANVLVSGNGKNVTPVANRLTANAVATISLKTSGLTYRFRYDGSIYQCVGAS
jgi:hypothetical protein